MYPTTRAIADWASTQARRRSFRRLSGGIRCHSLGAELWPRGEENHASRFVDPRRKNRWQIITSREKSVSEKSRSDGNIPDVRPSCMSPNDDLAPDSRMFAALACARII